MPVSPSSRPFTVALTGGIASGKTAVSDRFATHGASIVDTDVLAREVVAPGSDGAAAIRSAFGDSVFDNDDTLNRRRLRDIVFRDPESRTTLEQIVHPRIRQRAHELMEQASGPYVIYVIPLLVETNAADKFDRILVVDVDVDTQLRRLTERDGMCHADAERIIRAQASRDARLALADDIIDNSGPLDGLDARVAELHAFYISLAEEHSPRTR